MISLIKITDYNHVTIITLEHEKDVDVSKAFFNACSLAKKGDIPCSRATIPNEYLQKAGLKRICLPSYTMPDMTLKKTPEEEIGIIPAACRHCNSFDEGHCFHYGGICNPDSTECDNTHSEDVFCFFANGEYKGTYYMERNFTLKEISDFLGYDEKEKVIIEIKETV